MKPIYTQFAGALALTSTIAACVPAPRPTPPVQARPTSAPALAPAPAPPPVYDSWLDVPQTVGDWAYRPGSGGGSAQFGSTASEAVFTIRCDRAVRTVTLWRSAQGAGAVQMTIRSESQTRTLAAINSSGGATARLAANDRLLDAMALSKGRFAVEVPGTSPLYLPSWAEVTRVIEDCR